MDTTPAPPRQKTEVVSVEKVYNHMRAGSSARKFYEAAVSGGWDVAVTLTSFTGPHQLTVVAEWTEAPADRFDRIEGSFDPSTGAFWGARRRVTPSASGRLRSVRDRDVKISSLLSDLGHGPIWMAEQERMEAQRAAQQAAERSEREAALAQAAAIPAIQEMVVETKRHRNDTARDLKSSLEGVIARAQEALDNLAKGFVPSNHSAVLGQSAHEVERYSGRLQIQAQETARLEWMFGPIATPVGWSNWKDHREQALEAEAAETEETH
jgi:urease gamma subunit